MPKAQVSFALKGGAESHLRPCFQLSRRPAFGMPTVLRVGPYRFFFYSQEGREPPHIHIERDQSRAKFWLDPVRLHDSGGFRGAELGRLASLVRTHRETFLGAWHEFFSA